MVLEKTPESPLDSKDIKPVNLKGDQPEYSLEGMNIPSSLQHVEEATVFWPSDVSDVNS